MTGFINYVPNIPFATHNPAADQPNMEANTNAILQYSGVDLVPFNTNYSGAHNHVTFPAVQIDPSLPNGQSQIYPKLPVIPGASPSYLETFMATKDSGGNQLNGYIPFVKCMVSFTGLGTGTGVITPTSGYPIVNVQQIASVYQIVQSNAGKTITVNFATSLTIPPTMLFQTTDSQIARSGSSFNTAFNASSIVFTTTAAGGLSTFFSFMVI